MSESKARLIPGMQSLINFLTVAQDINGFTDQVIGLMLFKDQIHERDQRNYELERRMEEKERELNAIRLDHEAVG